MEENPYVSIVLQRLTELSKKLESLPDLSDADSAESHADHNGWMKLHDQLQDVLHDAEQAALATIPLEIHTALVKFRGSWEAKHAWGKPKEQTS